MYTRCSACHTVHPLNAALLAQGAGKYRCGKCSKLNNALISLFDEWPDAGQNAPLESTPPTLGMTLVLNPAEPDVPSDENGIAAVSKAEGGPTRIIWLSAAFLLLVATLFNFAWLFRDPLLANPSVRDQLVLFGLIEAPSDTPYRNLDQLQIISSDLRTHPRIPGALRLSSTIVNRADVRQAYPELEVLLLDSRGKAIARRLFKPSEYLAEGANINAGMTPQAYLPVVFDLSDPGRDAVGFEIRIR